MVRASDGCVGPLESVSEPARLLQPASYKAHEPDLPREGTARLL
jgi:hypothetical protein